MKLSAGAMFALLMATPVLADPPGDIVRNVQMSNDNTVSDNGSSESLQGAQPPLGTCAKLMERAFYLADPISPDRAFDARREMELARTAFQAGDEFDCQRHAMHALTDRS